MPTLARTVLDDFSFLFLSVENAVECLSLCRGVALFPPHLSGLKIELVAFALRLAY